MNDHQAIVFDSVSKKYRIYHDKNPSLKETIIHGRRSTYEDFLALEDVSFMVKKGETFGIIGPNGSGKSTILKLLARIIQPTSGHIDINGSVSALLELGAGFHPDLTGRENIYLNASILGVSRQEIKRKFEEIVQFAELERFIDTPVKNYSSGMYVRLGFAIAINVDPDILLIDEVLAVGDQSFQAKCLGAIFDFMKRGKTIVIVSHDLDSIANLCPRAIFLLEGKVLKEGEAQKVAREYRSFIERTERERAEAPEEPIGEQVEQTADRFGSGEAIIEEVYLLDGRDERVKTVKSGEKARICFDVLFRKKVEKPIFGIRITDQRNINVYGTNTWIQGVRTSVYEEAQRITVSFVQKMELVKGSYNVTVAVGHRDGRRYFDWWTDALAFEIMGDDNSEGIANLDSKIVIKS